jgi:hypothetical protein
VKATFSLKTPPGGTEPVEYVDIELPGSKEVISRAANELDRHRFKAEYAAFRPPPPVEPQPVVPPVEPPAPSAADLQPDTSPEPTEKPKHTPKPKAKK